ncbi:MAG: hypothetical protein AAB759_03070 [Patescibacteria group bacterium]
MHLSAYSLKRTLFEGEAVSLNCKTTAGEITVLDHHRPLVSELAKGTVRIVDADRKEHFLDIASGFLEIDSHNSAKLIVDEA